MLPQLTSLLSNILKYIHRAIPNAKSFVHAFKATGSPFNVTCSLYWEILTFNGRFWCVHVSIISEDTVSVFPLHLLIA